MSFLKRPHDIQPSGNWAQDNESGRKLANALIDAARTDANPCIITAALRDIAKRGIYGGVEVGFSFALAEAAMSPV